MFRCSPGSEPNYNFVCQCYRLFLERKQTCDWHVTFIFLWITKNISFCWIYKNEGLMEQCVFLSPGRWKIWCRCGSYSGLTVTMLGTYAHLVTRLGRGPSSHISHLWLGADLVIWSLGKAVKVASPWRVNIGFYQRKYSRTRQWLRAYYEVCVLRCALSEERTNSLSFGTEDFKEWVNF